MQYSFPRSMNENAATLGHLTVLLQFLVGIHQINTFTDER